MDHPFYYRFFVAIPGACQARWHAHDGLDGDYAIERFPTNRGRSFTAAVTPGAIVWRTRKLERSERPWTLRTVAPLSGVRWSASLG